jgi:hypothetical protein
MKMKSCRQLFFGILGLLYFCAPIAKGEDQATPPADFLSIYDFQNDWLVYSERYNNYVPYSKGINESTKSLSVSVDLLKNRGYFLLIRTEAEGYLFLNGSLQLKLLPQRWLTVNIDSLHKVFTKDELLVTIYGSAGTTGKRILLCNQKKKDVSGIIEQGTSTLINIRPIPFSSFGNFAVLALLMLLVLNAWIFNTNPLAFVRLINPLELFNNNPRDQLSKINKPYSNTIILFVIIDAMLMGFLLVFFNHNELNLFSVATILSEQTDTLQFLADFLLLSFIFFLLIYGKFVLMTVIGNMLNLDKLVDTLFLKIIQSTYFFYSLLFLLAFLPGFTQPNLLTSVRPYILLPFIFFYISRFVALYVVTKPATSFINLYLFSYLCVIEIIPLIIGIKFVI